MASGAQFGVKRFLQTSAIYFIGDVMAKIVSFFLLPLYTLYIAPAQFGQYDLVFTFINLVSPIAFFQIWDGAFRFSFDKEKIDDKYYVISNALILFSLGILLYLPAIFLICNYYGFQYKSAVVIYGFTFGLQYMAGFSARIFLDNKLFVASGIINTFTSAILNVVLIMVFHFDILSIYISAIAGSVLQISFISFRLKILKHFSISHLDRPLCLRMLRFSIPLCLATVSYWLLTGFTKMSITGRLGMAANGLYAVAIRFSTAIVLLVNVFQFSWNELAYLIANDESRVEKYRMSTDFLIKSVLCGTVVACVVIKWIFPVLVGPEYSEAFFLVPITIIGVSFNTVAGFLGTFFMMEKKTHHILYTTVTAAAFNCCLCYWGISRFGLQGALFVLSASFLLLMLFRILIVSAKFKMKLSLVSLLSMAFLPLIFLCYYTDSVLIDIASVIVTLAFYFWSIRQFISLFFKSRTR